MPVVIPSEAWEFGVANRNLPLSCIFRSLQTFIKMLLYNII